ncbi:transcriptional regulator [Salmonella enterica subsp. enterica serovar Gloucester]|nr:transcriptional regulator [Salmonella enterica subsp. enterica serovar Gloucester]
MTKSKQDQDWIAAYILYHLKLSGTSLAALSRANGLASGTLQNVLNKHWPKAEKIVADYLKVEPSTIWPSRYPKK